MSKGMNIYIRLGEKETEILNRISKTEQISRQNVIRRLILKEAKE